MPPKKKENNEQTARPDELEQALEVLQEEDFEDIVETVQIRKKMKLDDA